MDTQIRIMVNSLLDQMTTSEKAELLSELASTQLVKFSPFRLGLSPQQCEELARLKTEYMYQSNVLEVQLPHAKGEKFLEVMTSHASALGCIKVLDYLITLNPLTTPQQYVEEPQDE